MFPYLWAGTPEDGYHKVFLEEVKWGDTWADGTSVITEEFSQNQTSFTVSYTNGKYLTMKFPDSHYLIHKIEILEGHEFHFNHVYCTTTWDHEYWHSMGYQHGEYPLVTC